MKKTVLLVDPRKMSIATLSLMKFSTYFENKGWNVSYVEGTQFFHLPKKVDKIIVTGVFTFDLPKVVEVTNYYKSKYGLDNKDVHLGGIAVSLMSDYIREMCGDVDIHFGICEKVDELKPDYSLYPDIDYSIGYSTRGCIRKCQFCAVHKVEPKFVKIEKWENMLNMNKPRIQMLDNNFTACDNEWFARVCQRLSYFGKLVDFNQSVDCRIFTEFHAENFRKVRLECLRFSYDGKHVPEKKVRKAVEIAKAYGYTDIRFDVLYDWDDTPEEFYHRLDVLTELDCKAFPMKFVPLESLNREHVGEHWTKNQLTAFNKIFGTGFSNGMIGNGKNARQTFLKTFGNNADKFVEKLNTSFVTERGEIDKNQFTLDSF